MPALTALSECLPVLLTRVGAEAAFCSLGDWLNVCRMPRGVVAEPRDSWLEACGGERGPQLTKGRGPRRARCSAQPLLDLADLFPPTRDPWKSNIRRLGKLHQGRRGRRKGKRERETDRQTDAGSVTVGA